MREAVALTARSEGLLLDPVYTGKAMAGLIGLRREGNLPEGNVLFWHTGGAPGLFAYPELVAPVTTLTAPTPAPRDKSGI